MPNKMVFFFVFLVFKFILWFPRLNTLVFKVSLLELHRILVSFLKHLMLPNLHQNYLIIYTFLNHYLNKLDVHFLLILFDVDWEMMAIILLLLFAVIILLNYNLHLLLLSIMDFLFFIDLISFIYVLLVF